MNWKLGLGIAAAAGLVVFFTSEKGKNWLSQVGEEFSDLFEKGQDVACDTVKKAQAFGRDTLETARQAYNS